MRKMKKIERTEGVPPMKEQQRRMLTLERGLFFKPLTVRFLKHINTWEGKKGGGIKEFHIYLHFCIFGGFF